MRETALYLYALGLNVIPLRYGEKLPGYDWNGLKYARLPADSIARLFFARCNIGAITGRTKLVWLNNPNNPTGMLLPKKSVETLIKRLPRGVWLVLD